MWELAVSWQTEGYTAWERGKCLVCAWYGDTSLELWASPIESQAVHLQTGTKHLSGCFLQSRCWQCPYFHRTTWYSASTANWSVFSPNRWFVDSLRIYTQDQRKEHEESGSQGIWCWGRWLGASESMGCSDQGERRVSPEEESAG